MTTEKPSTQTVVLSTESRERISRAVVEAVADARGVSPLELEPPLYEAVDPDALEQFVARANHPAASLTVTFTYAGHEVTVDGDGDVTVERTSA